MKAVNLGLVVLLFLYAGPALLDPGAPAGLWSEGRPLAILLGLLLVPLTFLAASYAPAPARSRVTPRRMAAAYNAAAALILAWHAATMDAAAAHPVAFAVTEQAGSAAIALVAALNVWRLLAPPAPGVPAERLDATKVAGSIGAILAAAGILGSLLFFYRPASLQSAREWLEQAETTPEQFFPSEEARLAVRERLSAPSWFTPYCLAMGAAGLVVSGLFLHGSLRLLRQGRDGAASFTRGGAGFMLVAACILSAGLLCSDSVVRENIAPALAFLSLSGVLLLVARNRKTGREEEPAGSPER